MDDNYKHPADDKKVKFRINILNTNKKKANWIFVITIISFILSAFFNMISSNILKAANIYVAFGIVLIIILINIIFDIIGTAVTAADEAPFHSMAARKLYGARQAIKLIRNADKVSNFCNDVVGDICGVISGSASALIVIHLFIASSKEGAQSDFWGLVITGLVAAFTVGGKAIGKSIAIENSNYIIYRVGVVLKFFLGNKLFNDSRNRRKK